MRASYASTSLRWSVASVVLLFGVTVGMWWSRIAQIDGYEAARAAATIPVTGTVVWAEDVSRGDDHVQISYQDQEGVAREVTFPIEDAGAYPVGSSFDLRLAPGSPSAFPTDAENVYTPSFYGGIWLAILALVAVLPVAWAVRLYAWRRASRAPAERVSVRLYAGTRSTPLLASINVMVRVEDATGRRWFQRVMWEPWMAYVRSQPFPAEGRRARPRGPMLLRTGRGGLLWPAGRARDSEPGSEPWHAGGPRRAGTRWSIVAVALVFGLLTGFFGGLAGIALAVCYLFGTLLFFGGGPIAFAWRR